MSIETFVDSTPTTPATPFTDTPSDGSSDAPVDKKVDNTLEEFDGAHYGIRINGKIVWQSEGEPMLVDRVVISNARGEVTQIGSHNQDSWLDITVNERSFDDPMATLDILEAEKANARREKFEPKADKSREGYVEADPETGKPVDKTTEKSTSANPFTSTSPTDSSTTEVTPAPEF